MKSHFNWKVANFGMRFLDVRNLVRELVLPPLLKRLLKKLYLPYVVIFFSRKVYSFYLFQK